MPYDERFPMIACPVCDGTVFEILTQSPPHAVRCSGCGLGIEKNVTSDPCSAYQAETYDRARNAGTGSARWSRFHHDVAVAGMRLRQLAVVLPSVVLGSEVVWLDVGSGNGAVVVAARRNGWDVAVVEADESTCRELAAVLGVPALPYGQWLAGGMVRRPHVVSMFDVMEHMLDFPAAVRAVSADLAPGGTFVVEVPDLDACDDFPNWKHRRVTEYFTEHQYHFGERSLLAAVGRYSQGLTHVHTARPVVGKLQMAWRRDVETTPSPLTQDQVAAAASHVAQTVLNMPKEKATEALRDIRSQNPTFARHVESCLADIRKIVTDG